jgi:hypothetical protein
LIANQMVMKFEGIRPVVPKPGYVYGIPDAASELAKDVANLMNVPLVKLVKLDGKISVEGNVPAGKTGLGFEDICTKGTGWREGVSCLLDAEPQTRILPYEIVLLNRGGLSVIEVHGTHYAITALVEKRMKEWVPPCELCARGSERIKPKATEENWRLITTAQKAA